MTEHIEQTICERCLHSLVCGERDGLDADDERAMTFCAYFTPAAEIEVVRHGRWLPQVVLGQKAWDCSECKTLGSPHWKRCPVCEAKMEIGDV